MKKQSHIQRRRKDFVVTQNIALILTAMSAEQYAQEQYERGLQYLGIVCEGCTSAYNELSASKTFWKWWKNMWLLREEQFITPQTFFVHAKFRLGIWNEWHSVCFLTSSDTAEGKKMEQSYAQLIGIIIKQNIQKPTL